MNAGEGPASAAGIGGALPDNPFSASRVRPGAMPFLFARVHCGAGVPPASEAFPCHGRPGRASRVTVPPGNLPSTAGTAVAHEGEAGTLVACLRDNGWRGEIVGPHGSGKSALLAALLPALERAGQRVLLLELHDGQRTLPRDFWRGPQLASCTLLVIDGYEQLGRWTRFRLARFCRRPRRTGFQPVRDELETRPTGLLVTAHASVGLPELGRTAVDLDLACRLAAQLQCGRPMLVAPQDVAERFPRHGGNLRELLFDLYDLYERRQRAHL